MDWMIDSPKRGQIWLVSLDPAIGNEIKKTRPAVIISNNLNNQYAGTVTILPVSDPGQKVYPFEVLISPEDSGLSKPSKIKCQQIRTIDKRRLIKLLGDIHTHGIAQVEQALKYHLGLD